MCMIVYEMCMILYENYLEKAMAISYYRYEWSISFDTGRLIGWLVGWKIRACFYHIDIWWGTMNVHNLFVYVGMTQLSQSRA